MEPSEIGPRSKTPQPIYGDSRDTVTMRILIPYDGSEQADEAVAYVASQHPDAEVVLLNVLDFVEAGYDASPQTVVPGYWEEWYEETESQAEELLEEAADRLDNVVETEVVAGRPAQTIIEYVDEKDIDAIVLGSHGRKGISRILLGSVAETVVRRSPVPVTVVR